MLPSVHDMLRGTTDFATHHRKMTHQDVQLKYALIDLGSYMLDFSLFKQHGYRFSNTFAADWELVEKLLQEIGEDKLQPYLVHSTLQLHQGRRLH